MQATSTSTLGTLRRHGQRRLRIAILLIVSALLIAVWLLLPPSSREVEPSASTQSSQCDQSCRAGILQMGVIPPPPTNLATPQAVSPVDLAVPAVPATQAPADSDEAQPASVDSQPPMQGGADVSSDADAEFDSLDNLDCAPPIFYYRPSTTKP